MNDIDYVSLAKKVIQDVMHMDGNSSELIDEMRINNNFNNEIFYVKFSSLRALYICNERCSNEEHGVSFYGEGCYICFVSRAELAREVKTTPLHKLPNNFISSILELINFL